MVVGGRRRWLFLQAWLEMVAFGPPSGPAVATATGGISEKEVPLYGKMAYEVPRIGCWSGMKPGSLMIGDKSGDDFERNSSSSTCST